MIKRLASLLNFIICFFMLQLIAFALPIEAQTTNSEQQSAAAPSTWVFYEQQKGQYRYEFADNTGFSTNIKNNEKNAVFASFTFDSGINWAVYYNGNEITYSNGQILDDSGSYLFKIYGKQNNEGTFEFTVKGITSLDQLEGLISSDKESSNQYDMLFSLADQTKDTKLELRWEPEKGGYGYYLPNKIGFYASKPNGAVTTQAVQLYFSERFIVKVLHNDKEIKYKSGEELNEQGVYHFEISVLPDFDDMQGDTNTYFADYYVYVVSDTQNSLRVINSPVGFEINCILLNGSDLPIENKDSAVINTDGNYQFEFVANIDEKKIIYSVEFSVDTTAPLLTFTNRAESGYANKPVAFTTHDTDAAVSVLRNGSVYLNNNMLDQEGVYTLIVTDKVGNVRRYSVRIENMHTQIFNAPILLSVVLLLLIFGVYLFYIRRNTRVI